MTSQSGAVEQNESNRSPSSNLSNYQAQNFKMSNVGMTHLITIGTVLSSEGTYGTTISRKKLLLTETNKTGPQHINT